MNKIHMNALRAAFITYFFTMSYTTIYALWGISEFALITTCAITSCFCYQHKRTDGVKEEIKELRDTQKKIMTDQNTAASNMNTVASNISCVTSNVRTLTDRLTPQRSHVEQCDLQTAYDNNQPVAEQSLLAQLPGSVPNADQAQLMTLPHIDPNDRP